MSLKNLGIRLLNNNQRHGLSGLWLFLKEILRHPAKVGALVPSSKKLANTLAAQINLPLADDEYIIELGAGTGAITQALLDRGIAIDNIIIIERAKNLVDHLNKRFPKAKIIQGDAIYLHQLISGEAPRVKAIVSSLPLRSLPDDAVKRLITQFEKILPSGGEYIHYTYSFASQPTRLSHAFTYQHSSRVWQNIPPARVEVFIKK